MNFNPHITFSMSTELLGFISIGLVALFTFFIALRQPSISGIIFVAFAVRVSMLLVGDYFVLLPDSAADAQTYEDEAWKLAKDGFLNVMSHFEGPEPRFISWIIAVPYSLFGRSLLMAQSISLFFGIASVFLGWKLANLLWSPNTANKVGWTIALFPSLILYSILVMREVYISFFLLVALYGVCNWVKTENIQSIILAMTGFLCGLFFHGAMIVGAIIFVLIVGINTTKKVYSSLINYKINFKALVIFFLFIFILSNFLSNKIHVTYLGNFEKSTNLNRLMSKTNVSTRGNASWPEWTKINSISELSYKPVVRSIYFLFSPFPWDIKETKHLIGMFDALLYFYLVYLILCNIKNIWIDPRLRIILLILLAMVFVFGFGVGNFGTGIRHRSKFAIIFILLAAPLINRFILFKKQNKI